MKFLLFYLTHDLTLALAGIGIFIVSIFLMVLGGWRKLVKIYPQTRPYLGITQKFQSISVNRVNFNHITSIATDIQGIYLEMMFPFNILAKPIFIPWYSIQSIEYRKPWFQFWSDSATSAKIVLMKPEKSTLHLPARIIEKIDQQYSLKKLINSQPKI